MKSRKITEFFSQEQKREEQPEPENGQEESRKRLTEEGETPQNTEGDQGRFPQILDESLCVNHQVVLAEDQLQDPDTEKEPVQDLGNHHLILEGLGNTSIESTILYTQVDSHPQGAGQDCDHPDHMSPGVISGEALGEHEQLPSESDAADQEPDNQVAPAEADQVQGQEPVSLMGPPDERELRRCRRPLRRITTNQEVVTDMEWEQSYRFSKNPPRPKVITKT